MTFKGWQGRCFARQSHGHSEMLLTDTSAVLASKTGHFFVQVTLVSQRRFRRYRASAHVSESAGIVSTLWCCWALYGRDSAQKYRQILGR